MFTQSMASWLPPSLKNSNLRLPDHLHAATGYNENFDIISISNNYYSMDTVHSYPLLINSIIRIPSSPNIAVQYGFNYTNYTGQVVHNKITCTIHHASEKPSMVIWSV